MNRSTPQIHPSHRQHLDVLPEVFFSVFIIIFVTIRLFQQYAAFQHAPGADWNSSEWMIDYAAGFVRRGLGGEVLKRLIHLTGIGFFPLWATITTSIYLATCWHLMRRCYRLGGAKLWRFCILLNPLLLLFAIECREYGSFLRKEVLFVAATALLVFLCERTMRISTASPILRALPVLFVGCVLSTSLSLMHEGMFLFEWLPTAFVVLYATLARSGSKRSFAILTLFAFLLPSLAATVASFHWHGDVRTGILICESWHADSIPTHCGVNINAPSQFDAIGWTASRVAHDTLRHAWRFPFFALIFAFLAFVELAAIRRLVPHARLSHLMAILILPLILSSPIFLSNDWGRYLFTVTGQQIFLMLSDQVRPAVYDSLPETLRKAFESMSGPRLTRRLDAFTSIIEARPLAFCLILLILPVPDTMPERTLYRQSPPVILGNFVRQILAGSLN